MLRMAALPKMLTQNIKTVTGLSRVTTLLKYHLLRPLRLFVAIMLSALLSLGAHAQSDLENALALMERLSNPLVVVRTSQGDMYLELFPDAAPRNVERFLALANGQLAIPGMPDSISPHYYDGLTFHRVISGTLIQAGAPERANRPRPAEQIPDEINARGLGLEQQRLLDATGSPHPWMNIRDQQDFQSKILIPLYRSMNIRNEPELEARQLTVQQRLQQMNLMQAYENMGYRFSANLPSRRPVRGSVMMVNNGPGSNDGEFFITLDDSPWLTGTNTVIGRVLIGLPVAAQISRGPAATARIFQIRQLNSPGETASGQINP